MSVVLWTELTGGVWSNNCSLFLQLRRKCTWESAAVLKHKMIFDWDWTRGRPRSGSVGAICAFCCTRLTVFIHLALARDGLIEEQAAAVLVVQAGILRPRGAGPHTAQAGHSEWLQAVGGERWGRCGRVGLVTGGRPTPVAPRGAVARWREGSCWAVVLPRTT